MIIYILTDGYYSDTHIVGVYSKKEEAEENKQKFYEDDGRIEDWELDGQVGAEELEVYEVSIWGSDGEFRSRFRKTEICKKNQPEHTETKLGWRQIIAKDGKHINTQDALIWGESTQSFEHALKVAAERRQELLRTPAYLLEGKG